VTPVTVGAGGFTIQEYESVTLDVAFVARTVKLCAIPFASVERPVYDCPLAQARKGPLSRLHVKDDGPPPTVQTKVASVAVELGGGPEVIDTVGAGGFTVHVREAVAFPVLFDAVTWNVWLAPLASGAGTLSEADAGPQATGAVSSLHVTVATVLTV